MMNKKADIMAIIILVVIITITVLFFVGFQYAFHQASNKLTTTHMTITLKNGTVNVTDSAVKSIGKVDTALGGLKWVAFAIFIAMALSIFISSFMVKAHPVFLVVYICITLVAIIFSVPISNAYEDLLHTGPLSSTMMTYGPMNHVMLHLPAYVVVIGLVGAIFLFIGVTVDRESGGGLPI